VTRRATALAAISLTGCYLAHERDVERACVPEPVSRCEAWAPSGPPRVIARTDAAGDFVQLGSVAALDCAVLASWIRVRTATDGSSAITHWTRVLDMDGAPLGPILEHPSLAHDSVPWTTLELATGAGQIVGLTLRARRWVLVRLDGRGQELAEPIDVGADPWNGGLAVDAEGISFLAAGDVTQPLWLVRHDPLGAPRDRVMLPVSAGRSLGGRTRLEDGSFLLWTLHEDFATAIYEGWLERFDASGRPLGEEHALEENGVPVYVAETARGALATWMTAASGGLPLRLRPIDLEGGARGATRDAPAEGALYGLALEPTPDGGALVAWEASHFREDPEWTLRVQSLDADGAPLAEPTTVWTDGHLGAWRIVVDPSGARALLVLSRNEREVAVQPLSCAR